MTIKMAWHIELVIGLTGGLRMYKYVASLSADKGRMKSPYDVRVRC